MIIKGLWLSTETEIDLKKATAEEKSIDQRTQAEITLMIEPYNFCHIEKANTAHQAWEELKKAFEVNGLKRKVDLLKTLVGLKMTECDSMQEYVNTFVMTSYKCRAAGFTLNDQLLASLLLAGLPNECDSLVLAIENNNASLELDKVKNTLLQDSKFDRNNGNDKVFFSKSSERKLKCNICGKTLSKKLFFQK